MSSTPAKETPALAPMQTRLMLPSSLPTFRTSLGNSHKNATAFIEQFSRILKAHGIEESSWTTILPAHVSQPCANWIESQIENQDLSWKELSHRLIKHYQPIPMQQNHIRDLLTIKIEASESIQLKRVRYGCRRVSHYVKLG